MAADNDRINQWSPNDRGHGEPGDHIELAGIESPPYDPLDPAADCFRPPVLSTLVGCLHCGEVYESYLIEWRIERDGDGRQFGSWCCPISGCVGRGFGFDIFPIDQDWTDENGERMWDDDDDDYDDDDDDDYDDESDQDDDDAEFDEGDEEYEDALMGWAADDEAQWRVDEDVEDYEIDLRLEPGELDDAERPF